MYALIAKGSSQSLLSRSSTFCHVRPPRSHFTCCIPSSVQLRREAKLEARWPGVGDRGAKEGKWGAGGPQASRGFPRSGGCWAHWGAGWHTKGGVLPAFGQGGSCRSGSFLALFLTALTSCYSCALLLPSALCPSTFSKASHAKWPHARRQVSWVAWRSRELLSQT